MSNLETDFTERRRSQTFTVIVNNEAVLQTDRLAVAVERYYEEIAKDTSIDCAVYGTGQDEAYEAYSG